MLYGLEFVSLSCYPQGVTQHGHTARYPKRLFVFLDCSTYGPSHGLSNTAMRADDVSALIHCARNGGQYCPRTVCPVVGPFPFNKGTSSTVTERGALHLSNAPIQSEQVFAICIRLTLPLSSL